MYWGVIFYTMGAATVAGIMLALRGNPRWYWLAALSAWVASFLGAFSIGLYTLVVALITLALAFGHSLGLIRRFHHSLVAAVIGVIAWGVLVSLVDDAVLFYPFHEWVKGLAE